MTFAEEKFFGDVTALVALLASDGRLTAAQADAFYIEIGKRQADAQALADVRTLDDWASQRSHYQWGLERYRDTWRVKVQHSGGTQLLDVGATPDEARAKAAAWARGQAKGALQKSPTGRTIFHGPEMQNITPTPGRRSK